MIFDIHSDRQPIQRLKVFPCKVEALFSSNEDYNPPKLVYASRSVGYVVWDKVIAGIGVYRAIQIEVIASLVIIKR